MENNDAWIAMFRRLPGHIHELLSLVTNTGTEILVQRILRLEPDFMILRGRLAGTQDYRVMVIPYAQLTLISVVEVLKDPEVEAIFGKITPAPDTDSAAAPAEEEATEAPAEAPPAPPPAPEPAKRPVSPAPSLPAPAPKSPLVARLRDRLKDGSK
jgi:hypothetical protein